MAMTSVTSTASAVGRMPDQRRRLTAGRAVNELRTVDGLAFTISTLVCFALFPERAGGDFGLLLAGLFGAWYVVLGLSGSRNIRRGAGAGAEFAPLARGTLVVSVGTAVAALCTGDSLHRDMVLLALPTGSLLLLAMRVLFRSYAAIRPLESKRALRAVVVGRDTELGTNTPLQRAAFGRSYDVVGSVAHEFSGVPEEGRKPVSFAPGLDEIQSLCREMQAEAVIVTGSMAAQPHLIRSLGWALENSGTELVLAPLPPNISHRRMRLIRMEGVPLVQVDLAVFHGPKYLLKRAFDVAAATAGILLLSPLLVLVGLIIRIEDGQNILFKQVRVGVNGQCFSMLKFRTMCVDAEALLDGLRGTDDGNGVLFKLRDDPRVTRVGRWLRKFSIDELPQLFNVLMGHMSLVGPRPPLPREVDEYSEPSRRRLLVKPGLTGLWQVSGRSDLDWDESIGLDLYYVENWSVSFDLGIIWRTIGVVLRPHGAY
jgi:exopolysaccharide biosynthesis polyprenyl glycosylphosphotransferase